MKKTERLLFAFLLACNFLICGCGQKQLQSLKTDDLEVLVDPPHMTVLSLPEGLTVGSDSNLLALANDARLKSIFASYTDANGVVLPVSDFGLSVTSYTGTLEKVKDLDLTILLSTKIDGSGNLSVVPVVSATASASVEKLILLHIHGDFAKIEPNYTLTLDPTWPIFPKGYIQEVYYAENVDLKKSFAERADISGSGAVKKLKIGGLINNDNTQSLIAKYSHAIFGRFQVGVANTAPIRQSAVIDWKVDASHDFLYGDATTTLTILSTSSQEFETEFAFKDRHFLLRPGSWKNIDKWTVIYFKKDLANKGQIEVVLINFSSDFLRNFGTRVRWSEPPASTPTTGEVTVPVSSGVSDNESALSVQNGLPGVVELPPHQSIVFDSASSIEWTNDRFDSVEAMISAKPFLVDISPLLAEWRRDGGNVGKFEDWLSDRFEKQLVATGFASSRDTPRTVAFRAGVRLYVEQDLVPLLKDPSKVYDSKFATIDVRNAPFTDPAKYVARPFWKRMIIADLVDSPDILQRIMGTYFDVEARGGKLPQEKDRGYPSMTSRTGSLVGGIMISELDGSFRVPVGVATSFCTKGDRIANTGDKNAEVRLGINDDLPDDNGPGYAVVRYHFEAQ